MKETDLYLPVKNLFENLGYKVNAEVKNIDIIATKDNDLIITELKTSFNLKLILQAVERQKISNKVYVAIPRPKNYKPYTKSFKEKENLLHRLKIGLILVAVDAKKPYAQIIFDPITFNQSNILNTKRKKLVLNELSQRNSNNNIGGSKGKCITAYREKALAIVNELKDQDSMSVKDLRIATGYEKVQTILYNNYYGWFERVKHGVYKLSNKGYKAYYEYQEIISKIT